MTVSPIKTVLKNVSGNRYSFNLGMDKRITLLPAGGPYDTVTVSGDVFSQFTESRGSDSLLYGIIRNDIVVSYIVESVYKVTRAADCLQASTSNMTALYRAWANGKHTVTDDLTKEPVVKVVEEKREEVVSVKAETAVEEPKVSEVTIEPVTPVAEEVKADESIVEEAPAEPVVEDKKEEEEVLEEEPKEEISSEETPTTKKRSRRVKLS